MKKRKGLRKITLTPYEKQLEDEVVRGEWIPVSPEEFKEVQEALERARKKSILHMRINTGDLNLLKQKAKKMGVKYQSFIAEILHRVAHSEM